MAVAITTALTQTPDGCSEPRLLTAQARREKAHHTSSSSDSDSSADSSESSDSDEDASDPGGNVSVVCHARVAMGI